MIHREHGLISTAVEDIGPPCVVEQKIFGSNTNDGDGGSERGAQVGPRGGAS